ncbi:MAG: serine acetyltransferase [Prolixibacteraceae bacterium]|nr:serine acetyltransferase [Prolixibacteraceae bacterium]
MEEKQLEKNIVDNIDSTIAKLSDKESYKHVCYDPRWSDGPVPIPSRDKLSQIVNLVREILFPGFFGNTTMHPVTVSHYMGVYVDNLFRLLVEQIYEGLCFNCKGENSDKRDAHNELARKISYDFIYSLPEIRRKMVKDVESTYVGDPASNSRGEVIFCYPGILAISNYRIAHRLLELGVPLIPRFIGEMAHSETGIDIHPKAQIGESFMIDHGTGVVIGSTCIIGNNVRLYQGVTLGARSFPLDKAGNPIKGIPRHPIVEDNVIIYAQATILGRVTIGRDSVIGGNVWITQSVPANSRIMQIKGKETSFDERL